MTLLRQLRQDANMTIPALATKVGVSTRTITSWESGKTVPTLDNQEKLAKIFKIHVEALHEDFKCVVDDKKCENPQGGTTKGKGVAEDTKQSTEKPEKPEKTVTRREFLNAVKLSEDTLKSLVGESKVTMLALEFLKADVDRRLFR